MITENVLIALITGGLALVGSLISSSKLKNMILYRIEQLEKKQDVHNSMITRLYEAEKDISVLENRAKVAEHRIEDLEHKE